MDARSPSVALQEHRYSSVISQLFKWLLQEFRDARYWQIAALGGLLAWNISALTLGASLLPSLIALISSLATQIIATRLLGLPKLDLRSPLITGLSLSLLLRGDALWVYGLAGVLAIGSKFVIRLRGKHVFNPAAFAILLMLQSGHAWVSPGQWGQSAIIIGAIVSLGILVLQRASRLDVALAFILSFGGLLFARAVWLGDTWAIPLHQLESGALLLFTCFMITDPRTTPDAFGARVLFAAAVAFFAHWLLFSQQIGFGLYAALVLMSPLVPLLDRLFPARRFVWRPIQEIAA
jgi:Na+-transporting NADH:ubiquinone oxidoreductase subunit NqrB